MALFPHRRGDVPDVMAVKQSLEDVKGYVPQLPRKPRAVTVKDLLGHQEEADSGAEAKQAHKTANKRFRREEGDEERGSV
jgi:hypothetical protein